MRRWRGDLRGGLTVGGTGPMYGRKTLARSRLPATSPTDAAVFGRLIEPDHGDYSPEAAREILSLQFDDGDKERMQQLSLKAQDGTLTAHEVAEIESDRRAGYLLGVIRSKARLSLTGVADIVPPLSHESTLLGLGRLVTSEARFFARHGSLPKNPGPSES